MAIQNERERLRERLLGDAARAANPILGSWLGRDRLMSALCESIDPVIERIFDDALAEGFRECCPIEGIPASAYRNRVLRDELIGEWVAGIRFKNLDREQPFVDVIHSERSIDDSRVLEHVVDLAAQEFAAFHPRRVRFYRSADAPLVSSLSADLSFVAAPVAAIAARPPPPGAEYIRLVAGGIAEKYAAYAASYGELFEDKPELWGVVRVESRETLEACDEAGLLFQILVDGEWAGVFALERGSDQGLRGFRVTEFLLSRPFRGRRLAAPAQWIGARALRADAEHPLLYGTIASINHASRRTAKSLGRIDVSGYFLADVKAAR